MTCGLCGKKTRIAGKTCEHLARGPLVTYEKKGVCTACSTADVPLCADCLARSERVNVRARDEDRKRGYVLAERAPYLAGVELVRPHVPAVESCTHVKLGFCLVPMREPAWLESMWVKPVRKNGKGWVGTLDNDPRLVSQLKHGDEIEFEAKHVVMGRWASVLEERPHDCLACSEESRADLDSIEKKVLHDVRKWGWHVIQVFEEDEKPAFSYTIGLAHRFEHPELIVIGLEDEIAGGLLHHVAARIRDGERIAPFSRVKGQLDGAPLLAVPMKKSEYAAHLGVARWFHRGDDFETLQLIWPGDQPLLGTAMPKKQKKPRR